MTTQITTKPPQEKPTILGFLKGQDLKNELNKVLPTYLKPERMLRIALTELRKNPKLMECDPLSFVGAIIQCAQMGLEPDGQKAYLIPYYNRKRNITECQAMVGYKGMLFVAAKSNVYIETDTVYTDDIFEIEKGLQPKFKHKPNLDHRGEVKGVYALARFVDKPNMQLMFEYMSKAEVDEIMNRSAKYTKEGKLIETPWQTDYDAMARKTVIRRLIKYLPLSDQMEHAVSADELGEAGIQNNASIVDIVMDDKVSSEEKAIAATPVEPIQ